MLTPLSQLFWLFFRRQARAGAFFCKIGIVILVFAVFPVFSRIFYPLSYRRDQAIFFRALLFRAQATSQSLCSLP